MTTMCTTLNNQQKNTETHPYSLLGQNRSHTCGDKILLIRVGYSPQASKTLFDFPCKEKCPSIWYQTTVTNRSFETNIQNESPITLFPARKAFSLSYNSGVRYCNAVYKGEVCLTRNHSYMAMVGAPPRSLCNSHGNPSPNWINPYGRCPFDTLPHSRFTFPRQSRITSAFSPRLACWCQKEVCSTQSPAQPPPRFSYLWKGQASFKEGILFLVVTIGTVEYYSSIHGACPSSMNVTLR